MAATAAGRRATAAHRAAQIRLRAKALRDLQRLWRTVDAARLSQTIAGFAEAAATLIVTYRAQSAVLSARYVDDLRRAEGAGGALTVMTGDGPSHAELASLIRGAALAGIVRSRRRGFSVDAARSAGMVKVAGTAGRQVLAGGRDTVESAVAGDDRAVAWMRVTDGKPCEVCAMLASRGPVYKSEASGLTVVGRRGTRQVGDLYHDHCACIVEPVYRQDAREDRSQWPAASRRFREVWDETTAGAPVSAGPPLELFRAGLAAVAAGEPVPVLDPTVGIPI